MFGILVKSRAFGFSSSTVTEGNEDRDDLVRCPADWRLSEGSLHANGRLNRRGLVAIPTHESELARGSFVSSDFNSTNRHEGTSFQRLMDIWTEFLPVLTIYLRSSRYACEPLGKDSFYDDNANDRDKECQEGARGAFHSEHEERTDHERMREVGPKGCSAECFSNGALAHEWLLDH